MIRRLVQYFAALLVLLILAAVYQGTVARWIQPPPFRPVRLAKGTLIDHDDSLADLFPESAWQREDCKRLQTSNGTLLFQNWEQTTGDHWKLWPVTVVVGRGLSPESAADPIVMEARQGAEIKFTESLDVLSGGAPPIDRGRMIGPVEIRRVLSPAPAGKASEDSGSAPSPKSEADSSDRTFEIQTANVWIDHRRVWTTEAIRMQVGEAELVGRDLTLHLAASAGAPPSGTGPAAILDRMELIYLDRLTMPLEDGGLWEAKANKSPKPLPSVSGDSSKAMITVRCGGRVEYDFARDELALQDSVSLIHQLPRRAPDRFDCERLQLTLRDPTNQALRRQGPLDWLVGIRASGTPATAKLPSFDCEITAETIRFDALDGLFGAEGSSGVQIQYGEVRAELPKLTYQFDPQRPRVLGTIDAFGAGRIEVADSTLPIRRARWSEGFRLQPLGADTADAIESDVRFWVDGDVHASLADGGEFQADAIEGDLKPGGAGGGSQVTSLVPDWLKATGDVRLDTAALAAETDLLQLFFIHDPPANAKAGGANNPSSPRAAQAAGEQPAPDRKTEQPSLRQWVAQPKPDEGPVDPVARPRPVIRGDTIAAKLELAGAAVTARDLSVTGAVELVHTVNAGGQTLDARMSGEQLRLREGGGRDVLQLSSSDSSPARFEIGDGYFVGPLIQIWPSDNVVEINDAGEFQMPTAILPTGLSGSADGQGQGSAVRWIRPPRCRWAGSMRFNGRTATLTDGVDITATMLRDSQQWDVHMTGQRLDVVLQQGVQVRKLETLRQASIQQISLTEGEQPVRVEALRRAGDDVLEARHVMQMPQLTLTPGGGGKLVGAGPGWLRSWTRTTGKMPLGPLAGQDAPEPARHPDPNAQGMTGVHLVYHDSMVGHLADKQLQFHRGVRIGVRPVTAWDEMFDAQQMSALEVGESTLDCDRLRLSVVPGYDSPRPAVAAAQTPWEAEASGGVVFRTQRQRGLFEGLASRAAYTSVKDLFTVEGVPSRAAVFRQTKPNGEPGPELTIRSLTLHPETMEIQNMELQQFNVGALPSGRKR